MHERWIALKETGLDLTPLSDDEDLAALCESNYWIVSYDSRGMRITKDGYHLTVEESFASPIVVKRIFWCPGCMKSLPCEYPTQIPRHVATDPNNPRRFRQVLKTRPGYMEELYFKYPESYGSYKEQALRWLSEQPEEVRKKYQK